MIMPRSQIVWENVVHKGKGVYVWRKLSGRLRKALELTNMKSGDIILDVGCAWGYLQKFVSNYRFNVFVVGIDVERDFVKEAKRNVPSAYFVTASGTHLPFRKLFFTTVTCFEVIEHVVSGCEIDFLEEANRVLLEGGKMIISTPNDNFSKFLDKDFLLGKHRHYSPRCVEELLIKSGFKIELCGLYGSVIHILVRVIRFIFKVCHATKPSVIERFLDKIDDVDFERERRHGCNILIRATKISSSVIRLKRSSETSLEGKLGWQYLDH